MNGENEKKKLLEEITNLKEISEMELKSAIFLGNEADKLVQKTNDKNLNFEEKEKLYKEIESLYVRINKEINMLESSQSKLKEFEEKATKLFKK